MKVIRKDNLNRDHIPDEIIADNVNRFFAEEIADFLNKTHSDFFEVVCSKCNQVDNGQTGEYPCSECSLPIVWDE